MNTRFLALLMVAAFTLAAVAGETVKQSDFKTYSIGFADGDSAVEMVQAVVGDQGKVILDRAGGRLLVLAPAVKHAEVQRVVDALNVPPKNIRIEVEFRDAASHAGLEAGVQGGGLVVTGPGGTRTMGAAGVRVEQWSDRTTSNTRQQLLVMSGGQASIFVGKAVPYVDWLVDYGYRCGYVQQQQVRWERVGAALVVQPVVLGDGPTIRVRLTPELSGPADGRTQRIRYANVATEVTVTDGVPFSLGGLTEHRDFYSRFLIGTDQSGRQRALDIVLTARVVPAAGP